MLGGIKSKIIVGLIAVVLFMGSAFWITSLRNDVANYETQVAHLQSEYKTLKNSYDTQLKQRDNENAVLSETRGEIKSLDEELENTVSIIKNSEHKEIGDETQTTIPKSTKHEIASVAVNNRSDVLSADLIRVLDALCERVRGNPCPSPR